MSHAVERTMPDWVTGHAKTSINNGPQAEHYFYLHDDGVRHGTVILGTLEWRSTLDRNFQLVSSAWQIDDRPLGGDLSVQVRLHNLEYDFWMILQGAYGYWFGRPSGAISFDWSESRIEGKPLKLSVFP
jgi:hypothetical protein